MTFEGPPPGRRHDIMFRTRCTSNGTNLYIMPAQPQLTLMCTQALFKRAISSPIIKKVNKVELLESTTMNDQRKGHFRNFTPGVRSNQIYKWTLVLDFLVAANEQHIGLGADTTQNRRAPTSAMLPSLDLGTIGGGLSDDITITFRQRDTTDAHSCESSRIRTVDVVRHIPRHRER